MPVHLSLNSVSPPEIRTIVSQTFTDLKSKEGAFVKLFFQKWQRHACESLPPADTLSIQCWTNEQAAEKKKLI